MWGLVHRSRMKACASWLSALLAIGVLWATCAQAAEPQVYLLRGWFGVFSTGLDAIAEELKAKGIRAEALGHLSAQATVSRIVREGGAAKPRPIVLVGHSQGANNVIEMARALQARNISVDLLITLAPFLQDPVPANVVRAMNYYTSGWGAPLTTDPDFRGKLSNFDLSGDSTVSHVSIDKSAGVQSEITRAIILVSHQK
jgi:hypothetical protein